MMGRGTCATLQIEPDPPGSWCLDCGRTLRFTRPLAVAQCDACRRQSRDPRAPWPLVRVGEYRGELRDAVLRLKHGSLEGLPEMLGGLLAKQWRAVSGALGSPDAGRICVQPIPSPWLRRLERGRDHAGVLGDAVAADLRAARGRLLRQRWGLPQARRSGAGRRGEESGRTEQATHVPSRFQSNTWGHMPIWRSVLLVDDVRTTGATLTEAAEVLRRLGVKRLSAAVLAVSHDQF